MLEAIADEMLMRVVATQAAVYRAREQLERVSHLDWESPAGRAFRDRAMELAGKIAELDQRLETARIQIWSARADLAELETTILSGASLPGNPTLGNTLPPELGGVISVRGRS